MIVRSLSVTWSKIVGSAESHLASAKNRTSMILSVLLGNVSVGANCWIGPFTYIDGTGDLTIGDYVTVGVGTMIASHSTVLRDLSGGKIPMVKKPVQIGSYVFIGPHCLIEMGVSIGNHCVILAQSVIRHRIPAHSIVSGNPAKIVGKVLLDSEGIPTIRLNRSGIALLSPVR